MSIKRGAVPAVAHPSRPATFTLTTFFPASLVGEVKEVIVKFSADLAMAKRLERATLQKLQRAGVPAVVILESKDGPVSVAGVVSAEK